MPSNRKLKSDDVDGFMLAVWDSIVDLERDYDVSVGISVRHRSPRGHLVFEAQALHDYSDRPRWLVAKAEAIWPTHYSTSLHGLLYSLLVRLWRELDKWQLEEGREDSSAADEDRQEGK